MSLPRDELPDGSDDEMPVIEPVLFQKLLSRGRLLEAFDIHRATDDREAFLVHAILPENSRYVLRDRDDLAKRPISKLRDPLRLRMVDTAG